MTEQFKQKCKQPVYKDRLGKIEFGDNQVISGSDYLQKIVIDDACITNGTIVGSIYAKSIIFDTLKVYDLTNKEIQAQIGVIYADNSTEYVKMGKYIIQKETNEKTAKNGQYKGLDNLRLLDSEYVCGIEDFTNITIKDFLIDVCNQLNLTLGTTSFTNDDLPVSGNPFTNKETCRTVLKAILKCSLNFAVIDVDTNKLIIKWLDTEISETFTKNDYDNLEKNNIYASINSLIIRDSAVSGENVIRQDEDSIEEIGENQFIIDENYFLYTEELRNLAIDAIWEKVKGLTYVDCKLTTPLGRPYLKVGQKISIEDEDGTYFETYILKHQFTYDGTFYSSIESPVLTKEEENRKNTTDIKTRFRNTEISVDKINGKIVSIVEEQKDTTSKVNQTIVDLDGTKSTISNITTKINNDYYNKEQIDNMNSSTEQAVEQIKNTVETNTNATNLQITFLQEQLANGVTKVVTETGYKFDKDGLSISKNGEAMRSLLDNDGLVVFRDNVEMLTVRSNGVETENLKVRTYFTIGKYTRVEDYKNGTGFFHIGG